MWLFGFRRASRAVFTCVYFGSARFGWSKCVTHRLLPPIAARQYSSTVHSKPLNTAFSRSKLPTFQTPRGLRGPQFILFPLFWWKKKSSLTSAQLRKQSRLHGAPFWGDTNLLTNTFPAFTAVPEAIVVTYWTFCHCIVQPATQQEGAWDTINPWQLLISVQGRQKKPCKTKVRPQGAQ